MTNMWINYGIVMLLAAGVTGCAETPVSEEIAALKQNQEKMQKDLDEVKKFIAERTPPPPKPFQPASVNIRGAPFQGKPDAPATLVEFTDYQCPYCKRHVENTLPQIVKEYVDTGKLKYVLRDFPLKQIHSHAAKLAQAVQCAGDQGRGWEMHDRIFKAATTPNPDKLSKEVKAAGLNAKEFNVCMKSAKYAGKVEASVAEGSNLGVRGTPGFFMGKTDAKDSGKILATEMIVGAQPFEKFKQAIDKLLNETKQPQ